MTYIRTSKQKPACPCHMSHFCHHFSVFTFLPFYPNCTIFSPCQFDVNKSVFFSFFAKKGNHWNVKHYEELEKFFSSLKLKFLFKKCWAENWRNRPLDLSYYHVGKNDQISILYFCWIDYIVNRMILILSRKAVYVDLFF